MGIEFAALVGILHALGVRRVQPRFDSGYYFATLHCPRSPAGERALNLLEQTAGEFDGGVVVVPRNAMDTPEFRVVEIIGKGDPDELAIRLAQHCASNACPHEDTESCGDTADTSFQ